MTLNRYSLIIINIHVFDARSLEVVAMDRMDGRVIHLLSYKHKEKLELSTLI